MKSVHYSVAAAIITSLSIKNFVLSINFITLDRSDAQSVEMIMTWFAALCDSVCTGCSGTMEVLEGKGGKANPTTFLPQAQAWRRKQSPLVGQSLRTMVLAVESNAAQKVNWKYWIPGIVHTHNIVPTRVILSDADHARHNVFEFLAFHV